MTNGQPFRFRLERVRAVRERKETLAKLELAGALSRLSSSEENLRAADADVERALTEQRAAMTGSASVGAADLLERQAFLERVEAHRGASSDELARQAAEVGDRDAELTVAAGEHEMLKRLRDRRRVEHDREVARQEGNALDEIAVMRAQRGPT